MRSTVPMEGNPWPHDMVITVEDGSQQLLELLWLREAWGLQPVGDLPPRLVDEPERAGDSDDREAWETAWPEVWQEAANHAAVLVEPSMFEQLQRTGNGSLERAELLRRMVGPTWRDRFGDDAFDEHYQEWTRRHFEARSSPARVSPAPAAAPSRPASTRGGRRAARRCARRSGSTSPSSGTTPTSCPSPRVVRASRTPRCRPQPIG
ncbi:MAG: hypothetical protein ACK5LN_05450 [Propioniciclava sp.]